MSLIEECKKLRELEQQATPGKWLYGYMETGCIAGDGGRGDVVLRKTNSGEMPTAENLTFICKSRNLAPAMLEVLRCIQEGDASGIKLLITWLDAMQKNSDFVISPDHMQRLRRLQRAATLMEQGQPIA